MKINKINLKNYKKGYSFIPNLLIKNQLLNPHQKILLQFLMIHQQGFEVNIDFISKGCNIDRRIISKDIKFLEKIQFIKLKNNWITINLKPISIEWKSKFPHEIRTDSARNTSGFNTKKE